MPKLHSSKQVTAVLQNKGFLCVSQKGSHVKFKKSKPTLVVVVPANKIEIPMGAFRSILCQAQIIETEFKKHLK